MTPDPQLCIRSGWLALQAHGDYFKIPYPKESTVGEIIAVTRAQFNSVVRRLRRAGVPVVDDLDQAWLDFAGWRVNYDVIISRNSTASSSPLTSTGTPPATWPISTTGPPPTSPFPMTDHSN